MEWLWPGAAEGRKWGVINQSSRDRLYNILLIVQYTIVPLKIVKRVGLISPKKTYRWPTDT